MLLQIYTSIAEMSMAHSVSLACSISKLTLGFVPVLPWSALAAEPAALRRDTARVFGRDNV